MARKKELPNRENVSDSRSDRKIVQQVQAYNNPSTVQPVNYSQAASSGSESQNISKEAHLQAGEHHFASFRNQLGVLGLTLRHIQGDGNCLFRALGDQFEGHGSNHMKHRMDTVRYMIKHKEDFAAFIDIPFDRYMDNLSRPGTYAGQDVLVAFARMHKVKVIIHQLNSPLWQIGDDDENSRELHLFYHNDEHYSSVRRIGEMSGVQPAQIRLPFLASSIPCCADKTFLSSPVSTITRCSPMNNNESILVPSECSSFVPVSEHDHFKATNTEELVRELMRRSNCRDKELATNALIERGFDLDVTVDYLISLRVFIHNDNDNIRQPYDGLKPDGTSSPINQNKVRKSLLRREKLARKRRQVTDLEEENDSNQLADNLLFIAL